MCVENVCFNMLGTHLGLDHCYRHAPTAIMNVTRPLFLVFVLRQSFRRRNLKLPRRVQRLDEVARLALAKPATSAIRLSTSEIANALASLTARPVEGKETANSDLADWIFREI